MVVVDSIAINYTVFDAKIIKNGHVKNGLWFKGNTVVRIPNYILLVNGCWLGIKGRSLFIDLDWGEGVFENWNWLRF